MKFYSSQIKNCQQCNKEFSVWTARVKAGKGKFCSKDCYTKWQKNNTWLFTDKNPSKTDEGKEIIRNSRLGEKSHWWKGGITPLRLQIYRSDIFRNWRNEVFKRDNWICQECGTRGGKLEAHHLKSFSDIIADNGIKTLEDALACKELGDISNGITLCEGCHKLTENYGWKQYHRNKNNTLKADLIYKICKANQK